jgi:quercetin dioxygenase-like cupin family protein
MIHSAKDRKLAKGWFVGPWNSPVPIPIGYANAGINEKHYHAEMYEIYLIGQGRSTAVVNDQVVELESGDMLVVEPHEAHTFVTSSDDYWHFVIHVPFVQGDKQSVA